MHIAISSRFRRNAGAKGICGRAHTGDRKQKRKLHRLPCIHGVSGGGTPSVLDGEDTARLFDALYRNFTFMENPEITIEVNPGTVTREKVASWRKSGINRISIGLQSVNDDELWMLGRIHTYREFLNTYALVRDAGFDNINIDLISAIPGQTVKSWERTLRTAVELSPEHISAYSLIIEEGTPFYDMYGETRQEGSLLTGKTRGYPQVLSHPFRMRRKTGKSMSRPELS